MLENWTNDAVAGIKKHVEVLESIDWEKLADSDLAKKNQLGSIVSVLVRHTISDMLETCRELNFDLLPCELILPIQNATEQTAALIAL